MKRQRHYLKIILVLSVLLIAIPCFSGQKVTGDLEVTGDMDMLLTGTLTIAEGSSLNITNGGGITKYGGNYFAAIAASTAIASGQVVQVSGGGPNLGVSINDVSSDMPIGAAYNAASTGQTVYVVVGGVGYVKPTTGTTPQRGQVIYSSGTEAGSVDSAAALPAVTQHNREIGHWIENCSASTVCRAVLHFN